MNIRFNNDRQAFPLTNGQMSFWYINQMTNETANHFLPYEFEGPLQTGHLEKVLNALILDNEILRVSVSDWCAVQFVCPYQYFHLPFEDLTDLNDDAKSAAMGELYLKYGAPNFDLMNPPLLRACLVKLACQKHILILVTPHFAMDGAALHQLDSELRALYEKALQGLPIRTTNKLSLAGYISQEQIKKQTQSKNAEQFWLQQLEGIDEIYFEQSLLDISNGCRRGIFIPLSQSQLNLIGRWCSKYQLTQQMVFLALFGKVISKLTGNNNLCLTTVQENRDIDGSRALFGALLTSIPVPMRQLNTQPLNELFAQVKKTTLAVYEYRHVSWSIPFSIIGESKIQNRPWWLKILSALSGFYHLFSKQAGLSPRALKDFATIAAASIEDEKKVKLSGPQHRAMTINVNMLPSFYEQKSQDKMASSSEGKSACQITLNRQLDFPLPPDESEWEQNVVNFYIENHSVKGPGIRLSHQCLTTEAEQRVKEEFVALLKAAHSSVENKFVPEM
jgi:hypothetical protein